MKPQRVVVRTNQQTVDSHWNYLWLELLFIWTNLGLHAGVHTQTHTQVCATILVQTLHWLLFTVYNLTPNHDHKKFLPIPKL